MELSEVLKRDFVYWDIIKQEVVLEKETIRPDWSYYELRKGATDWMITEYYRDGLQQLTYSYSKYMPRDEILRGKVERIKQNKGNWVMYMVTMPVEDFEKTIKNYYFDD